MLYDIFKHTEIVTLSVKRIGHFYGDKSKRRKNEFATLGDLYMFSVFVILFFQGSRVLRKSAAPKA